jgi:hypothetical protein
MAGEHVTATGGAPPVSVGAGKFTGCSKPVTPAIVASVGQASDGGSWGTGGGGVGAEGFLLHDAVPATEMARAARNVREKNRKARDQTGRDMMRQPAA